MKISINTIVNSDIETVWDTWNSPEDIKKWNAASDDWHTTASRVDLREGGTFSSRMEAKDGSMGFNFTGIFTKIVDKERIEYTLEDNRAVAINFSQGEKGISVEQTFEADSENDADLQKQGWQNILNNFAKYTESKK